MSKRANGEGSIYQRKDGRWMGSITTGRDKKGKTIRKVVYGITKTEVVKKLDNIKHDIHIGAYVEPDKMTVKEWLEYWLTCYKKIKLKPRTYDSYESISNTHIIPNIGTIKLQKLTNKDIQLLYNKKYEEGMSGNYISKINIVLKSSFKQAVLEGIIFKNPAENMQLPDIKKKDIKIFTKEEQKKFEETAQQYSLYPAFITNLDTGLRKSEILALTWDDIDFEKEELSVNKNLVIIKDRDRETGIKTLIQDSSKTTNSKRIIPLTKRCVILLKQLKLKQQALSNIVFCSNVGTYISPRNYSRAFQKVLKRAKIEVCNVHTMRHNFATRLFEANVPAKTISQLLGHASVSFTMDTYTHVLPSTKKQAIELLEQMS